MFLEEFEYIDDEEKEMKKIFKDFEIRLIRRLKMFGRGASRKGIYIRDHLLENGPDYVFNIYRSYKDFLEKAGLSGRIRPGTYSSTRKYLGFLKRLDLIKLDKIVKVKITDGRRKYLYKRRYYKLNPDKINSDAWYNPKRAIYGEK